MFKEKLTRICLLVSCLLTISVGEVLVLQNGLNGYDGCIDGSYSTLVDKVYKVNSSTLYTYYNC